ncbi:MAG: hypothetical protein HQK50_07795 [Oligoflexia bacterium]|nr:hypothetical protein [Oligoflexia bacterium]MBF0365459.1 hypothetical protein [Oligoflexia bacterium]
MRKIILLFTLGCALGLALARSDKALANQNQIIYEYGQESSRTLAGKRNEWKSSLTIAGEEILKGVSSSGTLSVLHPDVSDGGDRKKREELWGDLSATYGTNRYAVTLGGKSNLSKSDYPSQELRNSYMWSFHEKTTIVNLGQSYRIRKRPPTLFSTKETPPRRMYRPERVASYTLYGDIEQVLGRQWKGLFSSAYTFKTKEQTAVASVGGRVAYAAMETVFAKLGYRYGFEDSRVLVLNDRGRFGNHSFESEVTWEPTYDLLLSFSYDLIIENEEDARTGSYTRVAFDQYGAGLHYTWNEKLSTLLRASYVETNRKESGVSVLLGAEWNL